MILQVFGWGWDHGAQLFGDSFYYQPWNFWIPSLFTTKKTNSWIGGWDHHQKLYHLGNKLTAWRLTPQKYGGLGGSDDFPDFDFLVISFSRVCDPGDSIRDGLRDPLFQWRLGIKGHRSNHMGWSCFFQLPSLKLRQWHLKIAGWKMIERLSLLVSGSIFVWWSRILLNLMTSGEPPQLRKWSK